MALQFTAIDDEREGAPERKPRLRFTPIETDADGGRKLLAQAGRSLEEPEQAPGPSVVSRIARVLGDVASAVTGGVSGRGQSVSEMQGLSLGNRSVMAPAVPRETVVQEVSSTPGGAATSIRARRVPIVEQPAPPVTPPLPSPVAPESTTRPGVTLSPEALAKARGIDRSMNPNNAPDLTRTPDEVTFFQETPLGRALRPVKIGGMGLAQGARGFGGMGALAVGNTDAALDQISEGEALARRQQAIRGAPGSSREMGTVGDLVAGSAATLGAVAAGPAGLPALAALSAGSRFAQPDADPSNPLSLQQRALMGAIYGTAEYLPERFALPAQLRALRAAGSAMPRSVVVPLIARAVIIDGGGEMGTQLAQDIAEKLVGDRPEITAKEIVENAAKAGLHGIAQSLALGGFGAGVGRLADRARFGSVGASTVQNIRATLAERATRRNAELESLARELDGAPARPPGPATESAMRVAGPRMGGQAQPAQEAPYEADVAYAGGQPQQVGLARRDSPIVRVDAGGRPIAAEPDASDFSTLAASTALSGRRLRADEQAAREAEAEEVPRPLRTSYEAAVARLGEPEATQPSPVASRARRLPAVLGMFDNVGDFSLHPQFTAEQVVERATRVKPLHDQFVTSIARSVGAGVVLAPVKGVPRLSEKIAGDYKGDASQVKDAVRSTVVVNTPDDVGAVMDALVSRAGLRPKRNLWAAGSMSMGGYRDGLAYLPIGGMPTEVQVQVPEFLRAKEEAHPYKERIDTIERGAKAENRDLTQEDKAELANYYGAMEAIFGVAEREMRGRVGANRSWSTEELDEIAQVFREEGLRLAAKARASLERSGKASANASGVSRVSPPGGQSARPSAPGGDESSLIERRPPSITTGMPSQSQSEPGSKSFMGEMVRRPNESDKEFAKRVIDKGPLPAELPERYEDYFDLRGAHVVVPLSRIDAAKSEEKTRQSAPNAARRMAAAARRALSKRPPITVRAMPNGRFRVVDGNSALAAARQYGWESLPVQVEGRLPAVLGASEADRLGITEHQRDLAGGVSPIGLLQGGLQGTLARLGRKLSDRRATAGIGRPKNPRAVIQGVDGKRLTIGEKTPADWLNDVRARMSDEDIRLARRWYQEVYPLISEQFGEEMAPQVTLAWLLSQQSASPAKGMTDVLRVWDRISGRHTIVDGKEVKGGLADEKIEAALRGQTPESGYNRKLLDFVDSAMGLMTRTVMGRDVRGGQPGVVDVWTSRDVGFVDPALLDKLGIPLDRYQIDNPGQPTETQYEYGSDKLAAIAEMLNRRKVQDGGWTAAQVQAVGWMSMQIALGAKPQTVADVFDKNTRRVSVGLDPGKGSDGRQMTAAEVRGIAHRVMQHLGTGHIRTTKDTAGAFLRDKEGSVQFDVFASPETIDDFMTMIGYAARQTMVIAARPMQSGKQFYADVVAQEGLSTAEQAGAFYEAVLARAEAQLEEARKLDALRAEKKRKMVGEGYEHKPIPALVAAERVYYTVAGFQQVVHDNGNSGVRFISIYSTITPKMQDELQDIVAGVAEEMGIDVQIENRNAEVRNVENDWGSEEGAKGRAYLDDLRARGRLQQVQWLEREYGPDQGQGRQGDSAVGAAQNSVGQVVAGPQVASVGAVLPSRLHSEEGGPAPAWFAPGDALAFAPHDGIRNIENGSEAREVMGIILADLQAVGYPMVLLQTIDAWGTFSPMLTFASAAMTPDEGRHVLMLADAYVNAMMLRRGEADYGLLRGTIAGYMIHEATHHIDVITEDLTISGESPRLDYQIHIDASFNQQYRMKGDLMVELAEAMAGSKEIAAFFAYPLEMLNGTRPALIKSEVIAQMGTFYFSRPALMRKRMPKAYAVMEALYGKGQKRDSVPARALEQARYALQEALQSTSAGVGVQGLLFRGDHQSIAGVADAAGARLGPPGPGVDARAPNGARSAARKQDGAADDRRGAGAGIADQAAAETGQLPAIMGASAGEKTDTPAFKRWFGDSKVVDATGKPLVVYHGTKAEFTEFDTSTAPAWFAEDPEFANTLVDAKEGGRVIPAYLAIKNPIDMDRANIRGDDVTAGDLIRVLGLDPSLFPASLLEQEMSRFQLLKEPAFIEGLRAAGYDGGRITGAWRGSNVGRASWFALESTQIKPVIGNYDRALPSILGAPPSTAPVATQSNPSPWAFNPVMQPLVYDQPGRWDNVLRTFQDNLIDSKRIEDAIRDQFGQNAVPEQMDVYLQDELYYGRVGDAQRRAWDSMFEPLLQQISRDGLTVDQVDRFLYARHARERNAQMAKINPGKNNQGLSGMTDADAAKVMADARANGTLGKLMGIARRVDAITRATRQLIVSSGLETQQTVSAWEGAYQNYVPLFREEDDPSVASGFSVSGAESRRAMGSTRAAKHILAQVFAQHERIIQRAERVSVARALYSLAKHYPDPSFWTTDVQPKKRHVDPRTGFVVEGVAPAYKQADNIIMVKVGGEERIIAFNSRNERAMAMARGLRNLDAARLQWGMQHLARVTRTMAKLATQWNPVFWVTNFTRDYQTMLANVSSTPIANHRWRITRNLPHAIRGMYRSERGKGATPWTTWANEFKREGGTTGFAQIFDGIVEREGDLLREIERASRSPMDPRSMARATFRWIGAINNAIENGVRLAAYVEARKAGISAGKSASVAKNLTVNFNRKGNAGAIVNSLYMFANASVQGNARMFEAMTRSRVVQAAVASSVMIGFLLDLINRALGDEDEDGNNQYEIIPDHVKSRNWIFMLPEGKMIKVPMPYGYHVFPNAGRLMSEAFFDERPHATNIDRAWSFVQTMFEAFVPFGSSGSGLQLIAPTVVDPIVQWGENKSWTGAPIRREQARFGAEIPEYQLVQKRDSEFGRLASRWLNDVSGGDDVTPGFINTQPSFYDHVLRSITLGTGQTISQAADLGFKLALDEEVSPNVVPFVNRFYGEVDDTTRSREFWSRYDRAKKLLDRVERHRKAGNEEKADEIVRENRVLIDLAQGYRRERPALSGLNRERKEVEASELDYADRRAAASEIERRRTEVLRRVMRESRP